MTEQEAKTKWCPMARVAVNTDIGGAAANRGLTMKEDEYAGCQGSGCMWWRWHADAEDQTAARGHCGVAGHPFHKNSTEQT